MKEQKKLLIAIFGGFIFSFLIGCTVQLQTCSNTTTVINNTIVREVPIPCSAPTECKETICETCQTCTLCDTCQDCSAYQTATNECLIDKYQIQSDLDYCNGGYNQSDDYKKQLEFCNETVIDYTNRLNNISYEVDVWANRNR